MREITNNPGENKNSGENKNPKGLFDAIFCGKIGGETIMALQFANGDPAENEERAEKIANAIGIKPFYVGEGEAFFKLKGTSGKGGAARERNNRINAGIMEEARKIMGLDPDGKSPHS